MTLKQALGIDVSKATLQVCLGQIDEHQQIDLTLERSFENSAKGCDELIAFVGQHSRSSVPMVYLMEATGVYHQRVAYRLYEQQQQSAMQQSAMQQSAMQQSAMQQSAMQQSAQQVSVVVKLANQCKKFAGSTSTKTKTDPIDARLLCQFALERAHEPWRPPTPVMAHLQQLCRERTTLLAERTALTNRTKALSSSYRPLNSTLERQQEQRRFLQQQITQIEQEIAELVASVPELAERIERILSIPGIGLITAVTVIAECDGFSLVKASKQLVSYAGLDIVQHSSGTHERVGRLSNRGNRVIPTALYMPAISAARYSPELKMFYQRIRTRHSRSNKPGILAVARKLLRIIYAIWRKPGEVFRPELIG